MAGKKGRKKRFWSGDEKRSICAQARTPGVSIAQVARLSTPVENWAISPVGK
jgi:transposase